MTEWSKGRTAVQPDATARRVLLVDLGFLGDAVHLIPALRAIRNAYRQAELHVVSTPLGCAVMRLADAVDRFWELELHPARRSWRAQWGLIRALRRQQYEVAINLSAVDRSILLTGFSGARYRVGHLGGREHFWNRWLIPRWAPRQPEDLPVYQQRLQALAALGFAVEITPPTLAPPTTEVGWAEEHVPRGALHLSLSASGLLKEWPVDRYAQLALDLIRNDPGIRLLTSGSDTERERERIRLFLGQVSDPRVSSLPARLSIPRLAAALTRCRLHVGPDSGVIHLAAALGVPTVSLVRRRGAFGAWLPTGPRHRAILAPCDCPDDRRGLCAAAGAPRCLENVAPATVAAAARELLAGEGR